MIYRTCQKHGELTKKTDVTRGGKLRSGKINWRCKICSHEVARKHYFENKEKILKRVKKYQENAK